MRVVAARAVAGATLVLLGGCTGGHPAAPNDGGRPTAASTSPVPAAGPSPANRFPAGGTPPPAAGAPTGTVTTTAGPTADACAAFRQFYDDLRTRGRADVGRLRAEAQAVQQAADAGAAFGDPADDSFLDDANALLGYVDEADFPTTGSVTADPVQEVLEDCS